MVHMNAFWSAKLIVAASNNYSLTFPLLMKISPSGVDTSIPDVRWDFPLCCGCGCGFSTLSSTISVVLDLKEMDLQCNKRIASQKGLRKTPSFFFSVKLHLDCFPV